MMFFMTRKTKDFKILETIIMSIFINVMNFKFASSFQTSITSMGKMFKSKFSIKSNPIFKSSIFLSSWFFSDFRIKSCNFLIHTYFRTMNSISLIRANIEKRRTFWTNLSNFISRIILMKTSFTAKNISAIEPTKFKTYATFFADFRFSDFFTRFRITRSRAVNLSLVIPRDFLITSFAIHAIDYIRCLLTSQSHRRIYG